MKIFLIIIFLHLAFISKGQDEYYTTELPIKYSKVTVDFLLGKIKYNEHPDFIVIDKKYTDLSPSNACLQIETYNAFIKMYEAALSDGIKLKITSASRNYYIQRIIWEKKWLDSKLPQGKERVKDILKYNAMPGTSRHHWGTEIDLMSPRLSFWASDYGKKVYSWLKENAGKYGFYQPYTADENRTGYNEERWHWSYSPLSDIYTAVYAEKIKIEHLKGFAGDKYLNDLNVIDEYVFGINK